MALVAKRNHFSTLPRSQKGQISIFFSASLVVFISIIAFVINVGLFVKAKINLQNATDAAAWSGAAVQARHLTRISYLNWEMRNIFKEWMYKYYVVGSINAPGVETPSAKASCGGACTDFRLAPDVDILNTNTNTNTTKDYYNFPATCIHIAGAGTNICKRYGVPGLPELGGYSMAGAEEASRNFIDALIATKINDCNARSKLNMLTNTTWAYNVLANSSGDTLAGRGPPILTDRMGAWPQAVELAMRIRNLEKIMNRPARAKAVCSGNGGGNCEPISTVSSEPYAGNERLVKAFYSGYRNLGNEIDNEMKESFTLLEIPPTLPPQESAYSASNFLIPSNSFYSKQFVDLKLMLVNYATFFAALIPRANLGASAACNISKVAIPVPGYPLGFYKNPNVLTYYAVRGQADFVGMFSPFSSDSIKLTAYAAAKPFGGRVGPMLFTQKPGQTFITPRSEPYYRSIPYMASLDVVDTPNRYLNPPFLQNGQFGPGVPLPINFSNNPFWVVDPDSSPVGGKPDSGIPVQFGIPNLVYDGDPAQPSTYAEIGGEHLFKIVTKKEPSEDKKVGLFSLNEFVKFKGGLSGVITPEDLLAQVHRVRAATSYEAKNYLIPTPNELNMELGVDSFGAIPGKGQPVVSNSLTENILKYRASFFAPLYSDNIQDVLFKSSGEVVSTIGEYMRQQEPAIKNYVVALNIAAYQTYHTGTQGSYAAYNTREAYKKAAEGISDISDVTNGDQNYLKDAMPKSCSSLSGQFYSYYYGHPDLNPQSGLRETDAGCPLSLLGLIQTYFSPGSTSDPNFSSSHYIMDYALNKSMDTKILYSAYSPGPYNGIGMDGTFTAPPGFGTTGAKKELMRRNFYSTKFVALDTLLKTGGYNESTSNFAIQSEGKINTSGSFDNAQKNFYNPLDAGSAGDLSSIKH